MNLNNFRRLIIFCAALLAGMVLGAMQSHAQRAPVPGVPLNAVSDLAS